jgi:hypothetical protein
MTHLVYSKDTHELLTLRKYMGFSVGSVLLILWFSVLCFCFACLRSVSLTSFLCGHCSGYHYMELRTRTHTIEEIEQHKPQYLKPEANSSTRATLGTRHRTKTSKTKTQHRKSKAEQYAPLRKTHVLTQGKQFAFRRDLFLFMLFVVVIV